MTKEHAALLGCPPHTSALTDHLHFACAINIGEFGRFLRDSTNSFISGEIELQTKVRDRHVMDVIGKSEHWARQKAVEADRAAEALEAEAQRLEKLLGAVSLPALNTSKSLPALGRGSSASAARAAAANLVSGGDDGDAAQVEEAIGAASPVKNRKALAMLSAEVRHGGAYRVGASGKPKKGANTRGAKLGWLKEERGPGAGAGPMPPIPASMVGMPALSGPSVMQRLP